MEPCIFKGCNELAAPKSSKCVQHRRKGICSIQPCQNQVYQRGVCVGHGARRAKCSQMGCQNNVRVNGLCHAHSKHRPAIKCQHPKCRSKSRTGPYCLRHIHCNKTRLSINAPTAQLGSLLSVISFPSTSVDNEHESYALDGIDPTSCFDYTSMIDQLDLTIDAVEDCRQVHSYDSTDEKADREAADKAQYARDIDELIALLHEGQFDP